MLLKICVVCLVSNLYSIISVHMGDKNCVVLYRLFVWVFNILKHLIFYLHDSLLSSIKLMQCCSSFSIVN
jgi:hypothetical protein